MKYILITFFFKIIVTNTCNGQTIIKNRTTTFVNSVSPTNNFRQDYKAGLGAGVGFNGPLGKSVSGGFEMSTHLFFSRYTGSNSFAVVLVRPNLQYYFSDAVYGGISAGPVMLISNGGTALKMDYGFLAGILPGKRKHLDFFVKYDFISPRGRNFQWLSVGAGYCFYKKSR